MRLRILTTTLAAVLLVLTACGGDDSGSLEARLSEAQERDASGAGDLSDLEDLFGGQDMEDLFGGEGLEDLFGGEGMEGMFGGEGMEGLEDMFGGMFGGECMSFFMSFSGLMMGSAFLFMGADAEEIAEMQAQAEELAAQAPPEIRDDVAIVAGALSDYYAELGNTPMSQWDEIDDFEDDPRVEAAGERIDEWFEENCAEEDMFGGMFNEDMFGGDMNDLFG